MGGGMQNLPDPALLHQAAGDLNAQASSLLGGGMQPQPNPPVNAGVDFGASMTDAEQQLMAQAIEESMQNR